MRVDVFFHRDWTWILRCRVTVCLLWWSLEIRQYFCRLTMDFFVSFRATKMYKMDFIGFIDHSNLRLVKGPRKLRMKELLFLLKNLKRLNFWFRQSINILICVFIWCFAKNFDAFLTFVEIAPPWVVYFGGMDHSFWIIFLVINVAACMHRVSSVRPGSIRPAFKMQGHCMFVEVMVMLVDNFDVLAKAKHSLPWNTIKFIVFVQKSTNDIRKKQYKWSKKNHSLALHGFLF